MGKANVQHNLVDDPIVKISEFAIRQQFPHHFQRPGVFEIEITPRKIMTVTEPLTDFYINTGVITLICRTGNDIGQTSHLTMDAAGNITGIRSFDSDTNLRNAGDEAGIIATTYLANVSPDVIAKLKKIGTDYATRMKPMIDERDRVRNRLREVVSELIPSYVPGEF